MIYFSVQYLSISSLPSHSKTTSTSFVEFIEYASNSNSSYKSLVASINDENGDENTVSLNCSKLSRC